MLITLELLCFIPISIHIPQTPSPAERTIKQEYNEVSSKPLSYKNDEDTCHYWEKAHAKCDSCLDTERIHPIQIGHALMNKNEKDIFFICLYMFSHWIFKIGLFSTLIVRKKNFFESLSVFASLTICNRQIMKHTFLCNKWNHEHTQVLFCLCNRRILNAIPMTNSKWPKTGCGDWITD